MATGFSRPPRERSTRSARPLNQIVVEHNPKGQPTVYVSSTFIDLEGHRAALKTALEKARYDVCQATSAFGPLATRKLVHLAAC